MPTAILQQTTGTSSRGLQQPRPGSNEIKSMRKSKLMKNPAFKSMYHDIEKHQQDVKLAHLTGKPKDLIESTEKDAKFYNILSKMLCEVIQQRSDSEQKGVLQKVYLWYKSNRHVLYTGPRFGKEYKKKEAEAALKQSRSPRRQQSDNRRKSYDIVSQHSNTVSHSTSISQRFRSPPHYDEEEQYAESCDDFSVNSVNSAIDLDLTTEVDYDEVLNRESECGESVEEQEVMMIDITQEQPVRPRRTGTAYSSPLYFKGRKIQQPVSRGPQKMVHSIASLVNPHLNTPRMGDNSSVADGSVSTVVFRPTTAPNSRADMLQSWQMFNKERTYGQDIIGKMNFVGRSGTGLDVRYNAHELGEMPERKTKQVLKEAFKEGRKQTEKTKGGKENVLTSQTLEEFYETADKFYPVKVPKLHIDIPRSGQSRLRTPVTPLGRNFIQSENRSPSPVHTKPDLKLDTVVNMIDNVTDEMEFYKEKLIQPPALGFRRPAVSDVPVTPTPVMTPANFRTSSVSERFNTPIQPPSSLIAENTFASNISTSTPVPQTPLPGIDWRGRITPEPNRYRSKQKFGNHTYVKKSERPSLRSAGGVTAGHRPKTAPGPMKSKWKTEQETDPNERVSAQASSHMTTSVNQSDLDNMMVIQHLIGDSASQGGSLYEFDMEFWRRMRRMNQSAGSHSTNQQLEYLSLLAAQQQGEATNRSVSAPVGHHQVSKDIFKMENLPEKMCCSPAGISSIGEYNTGEINEVEEELKALHDDQSQTGEQKEEAEVVYNMAISAIPSEGQGPLPANRRDHPLQTLTISDAWQYSMQGGTKQTPISRAHSAHSANKSVKGGNSEKILKQRASNSKQALRTETYSLEYLPDGVLPKVERSAGRMPGNVDPVIQLMQMAQRQKASLHRTQPVRTPPSIPSPYGTFGARSPRSGHKQYQKELEEHARKTHSPRRFMQHVHDLRQGLQTAPAGTMTIEEEGLMGTLQVQPMTAAGDYLYSILKPQSAVPYSHFPTPQRPVSGFDRQVTFGSELTDGMDEIRVTPDHSLRQKLQGDPVEKVKVQSSRSVESPPKSIANIGRPIAQVAQIPDPDDVMKATMLQKQMSAAVDIQRIFRGYVARENYKLLLKDYREGVEDSRKAALQIQRHYRGHLSRKAAIYNRHPNTETLEWARQYRQILIDNEHKRQQKREELAEKNVKNYVSAVNKLEVVGPHVDIYQVYHPMHLGTSRAELNQAAVVIQKLVRGWVVRRKLEKLKRKAVCYGSVFPTMVKEYKNMLIRVQKFHGIEKFKTPFCIAEMNVYLDNRRRYEGVFERRSFGGEIEAGDVEQYFKECDLFPSQVEIEEAREMVCRKPGEVLNSEKGISKKEILDMLYYIYVPKATGLALNRKSTWMNPIIDGVEAKKLIGSHLVEDAPLQKCADLVIEARREERQREMERKKMKENETNE
ncbi:hypothetical protein LOTGIDRAFT_234326 [Lottia gigantea]|uniref:Uncharacterized protein n=1 Tax=Lottia gigantea TaxID=225164 RepID=V4BLH5_LOTGI|nr:hypothetical protein LOTGIDRAFT_234326 [Lottia gigantea]ESO89514.1 hypothetical protein LOTGIDRAFT_234326 [Lottia gigantea]